MSKVKEVVDKLLEEQGEEPARELPSPEGRVWEKVRHESGTFQDQDGNKLHLYARHQYTPIAPGRRIRSPSRTRYVILITYNGRWVKEAVVRGEDSEREKKKMDSIIRWLKKTHGLEATVYDFTSR